MSIGRACGGYFLTAGNGESGFANRDREPEAGSLHYALAYPCPGVGGERLYTLLRPTACQGGEGHAVARGDCPRHAGSQQPEAGSRKSALRPCPPLSKGGWRAPIYSLAPHCLSGGRGPRSGEGGLPKARREPAAGSRQPTADKPSADSGQRAAGRIPNHFTTTSPRFALIEKVRQDLGRVQNYCFFSKNWFLSL